MKIFAWIISILNLYFGITNLLNAFGILNDSNYSVTSNWVFGILFLGLGAASIYFLLAKDNNTLAALMGISPWILGLVFLLSNMLTSDYK